MQEERGQIEGVCVRIIISYKEDFFFTSLLGKIGLYRNLKKFPALILEKGKGKAIVKSIYRTGLKKHVQWLLPTP